MEINSSRILRDDFELLGIRFSKKADRSQSKYSILERGISVIHQKRQLNKKESQGMIELQLGECKQNNQNTGGSK